MALLIVFSVVVFIGIVIVGTLGIADAQKSKKLIRAWMVISKFYQGANC